MSSTMPWTIKIETTEGCNRECVFCPVPDIYGKRYNFLTVETAIEIVKQLYNWDRNRFWRFELAMLGEPTMNKNLPSIICAIKTLPKAQVTVFTNGDVIKGKLPLLEELFASGLNVLGVDCYTEDNLKFYTNLEMPRGITKFNYFDIHYDLYARKTNGDKIKHVIIINDLLTSQDKHTVRKLHNFGGNKDNSQFGVVNPAEPIRAGCEKPFRDLVVTHAGDVIVCCMDANKDLKIGNIYSETLKDIWYGEKYMEVRLSLAKEERIGRPCDTCSYFGGFKRFLAVNDFKELMGIDPKTIRNGSKPTQKITDHTD